MSEAAEAGSRRPPAEVTLPAQYLDALTKEQLLRLAYDLEVEGQSAMSKQELIDAIVHGGGVRVSVLSKEELLRVARSTGSEVGTAMTKSELIATIATP